jgi:hypothetical protein
MKQATALAKDLEAKYNLEDIDVYDKENGVVQIFAVSDDFMDMDPNMLSESSKGAMNYFNDLKYYYQKAFRYLDVEEREEYKLLAKDFFSNLQIDDKVRAVGLEEAKDELFSEAVAEGFKVGQKVTYLGHPAEITKVDKDVMDRVYYNVSYDKGSGKTKVTNIYNKDGEIKASK